MTAAPLWDLSGNRAADHEKFMVPAVYAQWANHITSTARVDAGHEVLDVGCGSGVLARAAAEEAGFQGRVTGLDHRAEMLEVARRIAPNIEWHEGSADELPFADASFDRVLSQFALPHVSNRVAALREMWRVLKPGGRFVLAVWAPLHFSPGYTVVVEATRMIAGAAAGNGLARPFSLGREQDLMPLLLTAGIQNVAIRNQKGTARFPSVKALVEWELGSRELRGHVDDKQRVSILNSARRQLERFRLHGGEIVFPMDATVLVADKR